MSSLHNLLKLSLFVVYLCKIFGIIQFTYNWQEGGNLFVTILNYVVVLPHFSLYSLSIKHFIFTENNNRAGTDGVQVVHYTNIFIKVLNCFNILLRLVWYFVKKDDLKRMLHDVELTKAKCEQYTGNLNGVKQKRILPDAYVPALLLITMQVLNLTIYKGTVLEYVIEQYPLQIPLFISTVELLFVSEILRTMEEQFKAINYILIKEKNTVDLKKVFPLSDVKFLNKLKVEDKDFHISKIHDLSHLHYDLTLMCSRINYLNYFPLILTFINAFVDSVNSVYLEIDCAMSDCISDLWLIAKYGLCSTFSLQLVYFIVNTWDSVTRHANRTSTYVHDIWNKYASEGDVDGKIQHLQLISLRLLNVNVDFTVGGFFPLNWSVLHTIVAATTTYLIILIQFKIM